MKMDDLVPEAGNLESFIKQFEVFARAPGGVDTLRKLILKLAVKGLLVTHGNQNSIDLLDESKNNRSLWVKDKRAKKVVDKIGRASCRERV